MERYRKPQSFLTFPLTHQRQSVIIKVMIKTEIQRLVSLLQAMTLQRMKAIREGKLSEAEQIRSVQEDIDGKIQELTCLAQIETAIRK